MILLSLQKPMNSHQTQPFCYWIQHSWISYPLEDKKEVREQVPELPGLYGLIAQSQDGQSWILLHIGHSQTSLRECWDYCLKLPIVKILHQLSLQVSLALFALPKVPLAGISVQQLCAWEEELIAVLEPMLTKTPAALQVSVN